VLERDTTALRVTERPRRVIENDYRLAAKLACRSTAIEKWRCSPAVEIGLFASVGRGAVIFMPTNFADSALLHRDSVEHISFGDRALVVGNDDELGFAHRTALGTRIKRFDVRLVQRCIHLVQHTEGTRPHHVNRKSKATAAIVRSPPLKSEILAIAFPGGFAMISIPPIQGVILVQQLQVSTAAAKQFGKHLAKIRAYLFKGIRKEFLSGGIDSAYYIEQFPPRICQVRILRFPESDGALPVHRIPGPHQD